MKAKGTRITRRVITTVSALVATLLVSGTVSALAYPLDHDGSSGPALPAAPRVVAEASGGNSWVIALIVAAAVVALAAALIGTVRIHRIRTREVVAGF
jgi:hypothetical protein